MHPDRASLIVIRVKKVFIEKLPDSGIGNLIKFCELSKFIR